MSFRELGNEQFKAGQFKEAETLYTQAYVQIDMPADWTDLVAGSPNTLDPTPKSLRIAPSRD